MFDISKVTDEERDALMAQGCTCFDQYRSKPCPLHSDVIENPYDKKNFIITDANMVREKVRQWTGYTYICPRCGEASVMEFMNYCGACGAEVKIHSDILTAAIDEKNLEQKQPQQG